MLIGTYPGGGYYLHPTEDARAFFAGLLAKAGVNPQVRTDNPKIQARLHSGEGGNYLWVTNPTRSAANTTVTVDGLTFQKAQDVWGGREIGVQARKLTVTLPARDGAVIALK